MRDRRRIAEALYSAITPEQSDESIIGRSAIGDLEPAPFREGIKYKIRRLQYLDRPKPYVRPSKPKKEPVCDGIMVHKENIVKEKPKASAPRPQARKINMGYETEATAIKVREAHYGRYAIVIQKWWRGHSARLYFKRAYKTLRHRRIQRERAAVEIQTWYRGSVLTQSAMDDLLDRKYLRYCTMKIQRWYRGCRARKQFHAKYDGLIKARQESAVTIQRLGRGYLGRRVAQLMRNKIIRFRMAGRIMRFLVRCRADMANLRERLFNRRWKAAVVIQAYTRRYLAQM